jgi:hypothetical protein
VQYTSLYNWLYWSVSLQDIKVGKTTVRGDEVLFAILDTGTTLVSITYGDLQRLAYVFQ